MNMGLVKMSWPIVQTHSGQDGPGPFEDVPPIMLLPAGNIRRIGW